MSFEAFGVQLELLFDDRELEPRVREILPPGWTPSRAGAATTRFALRTTGPDTYEVTIGGVPAAEHAPLEVALTLLDSQMRLLIATGARAWLFVHAGVVAIGGRVLVIPGGTFTGKTTLVRALVAAGAVYYSDEYAVLDASGLVHAYPRPPSLRSDLGARVRERRTDLIDPSQKREPAPMESSRSRATCPERSGDRQRSRGGKAWSPCWPTRFRLRTDPRSRCRPFAGPWPGRRCSRATAGRRAPWPSRCWTSWRPWRAQAHDLARGRRHLDRLVAEIGCAQAGQIDDLERPDRRGGWRRWEPPSAPASCFRGLYNETAWAPIALGALGLVVALAVAAPRLPPMALLAPVLGLWLWSLVSSGWSDSTDAAHVAANRWLLYGAAIVVLAWALGGDRRRAAVLLTSASAGVLVVAAWMLVRMLAGDGPSLFLATRLNDPLGYVNGQAAYLLVAAWPCLALAEHRGSKASWAIAGIGMAALVALLGLGLLCQSRSWEVALFAAIVVLEVAFPGRRRRAAALLLTGATLAVIYAPLAAVWRHPSPATGVVTAAATRHAAASIVAGAIVAGLVWAVVVLSLHRLAPAGSPARARVRRLASAALVALGLATATVIVAGSPRSRGTSTTSTRRSCGSRRGRAARGSSRAPGIATTTGAWR